MKINILKRITHNWHIKLLSVGLACIIWIYVNSIQERERFLSVPLEVKNVPPEYIVSSEIPQFVKLVLRGKETKLALINDKNVRAYVDLEKSTRENIKKIVKIDKANIPQGVAIKEISPRSIHLKVEKTLKKVVKVVPVIVADLPDGYDFEDVILEPDAVEIEGPESLLKEIGSVYTNEINIENLTETTVIEKSIDTNDERFVLVDDTAVKVKIVIKEEYAVERVDGITVHPINVREGFSPLLEVSEVTVLLKMPKRIEKRFSKDQIYVYVDCADIENTGEYHLPLFFRSELDDVTLLSVDPQSVKIRIE